MIESKVPEEIPVRYVDRPSAAVKGGLAVLLLVGVVAFFLTLGSDPERAWRSYIANWLFFTSIAQGAVIVAVVTTITRGEWAWSVQRIAAAFGAFLPISFLLLVPLLAASGEIFPWIEEMAHDPVVQKKRAYLNVPFLVARNAGGLLLLFGLSLYYIYLSVRPDLKIAAEEGPGRRAALHRRFVRRWRGQEAEEVRSYRRLTRVAPLTALVYALVLSVVAIDWIMSLEPHWLSTLLGP